MTRFRSILVLAAALALSACSTVHSAEQSVFGEKGETWYSGRAGLEVRASNFVTSKVIGRLALYEPVERTKTERGFAQIESAKSGLKGWVEDAGLIARLPDVGSTPPARPATE
jgi:hypothetical protein